MVEESKLYGKLTINQLLFVLALINKVEYELY